MACLARRGRAGQWRPGLGKLADQRLDLIAGQLDPRTPPYERITRVFAPGDSSYPLINYEYAVVSKLQPQATTADALRSFLLWAISETGGNAEAFLRPVGFIALPNFIRGLSEAQIAPIKSSRNR